MRLVCAGVLAKSLISISVQNNRSEGQNVTDRIGRIHVILPLLFLLLSIAFGGLLWRFLSVPALAGWVVASTLGLMPATIWTYYDSQRVRRDNPDFWKKVHGGHEISPFWMAFGTFFLCVVCLPVYALELRSIRKMQSSTTPP